MFQEASFDDMWPILCRDVRVVRYDRRGYGRSPAAKASYSPQDDLAAVMAAAKMDHASLVGFSFGGIVTIASAGPQTGFVSGSPCGITVPDFGVTCGEVSSFGGFTGGRVPYTGRNTFKAPTTLRTVDFRISRDISIHERF